MIQAALMWIGIVTVWLLCVAGVWNLRLARKHRLHTRRLLDEMQQHIARSRERERILEREFANIIGPWRAWKEQQRKHYQ